MGGLGYAFAGAMQGLGAGIAETGRSADAERRATALENLRSSNNRAEQEQRTTNQDWLNSRQTGRETDSRITIAKEEGGIAEKRDAANFGRDVQKIGIQHGNTLAEVNVRAELDRRNDAASRAQQAALNNGEMTTIEGGDGFYYFVDKNGKREKTDIPVPERKLDYAPTAGSGGTVLDAARGGGGVGQASAPARAPARPTGGKTMSRADIAATAKAKGMTPREAQRILEELGYRLTD